MTIFWIVAAVGCAAGALGAGWWAYTVGGWADFVGWPLALVLAAGAVVSAVGIFTASATAKCPSCGAGIHAFDPAQRIVLCDQCHAHARLESGTLHSLATDYEHDAPVFTAELGPEVTWAGCVACCAPPTRSETLEIAESQMVKNAAASAAGLALVAVAGAGFVQTGGGKLWRVPVPYCDQHARSAIVATDFGTPVIRFRSYRAYGAFLTANARKPSPPPGP